MMVKNIGLVTGIFVIFSLAAGALTVSLAQIEYPFYLIPLPKAKQQTLTEQFKGKTDLSECGFDDRQNLVLDEFGFVYAACREATMREKIINNEKLIEGAKDWLVKYAQFTGVTKKSGLVVANVLELTGCVRCDPENIDREVIKLKITFQEQTYNGLPIKGGDSHTIEIFTDAFGVSAVSGHWFPVVRVPSESLVPESFVKNSMLGRSFAYKDLYGNTHQYKATEADLQTPPRKVIFVQRTPKGLEFHVAWEMLIGQERPWIVYIDAMTTEDLRVVQMFKMFGSQDAAALDQEDKTPLDAGVTTKEVDR